MSDSLTRTAQRCSRYPSFLGYWLARHAEARGLTLKDVLTRLGTLPENRDHVCLCTVPSRERWQAGLAQIAARFGLDAAELEHALASAQKTESE